MKGVPVAIDPANVGPGEFPPLPTDKDALLIESLRFANRVSGLLNELNSKVLSRIQSDDDHSFDDLHDLLKRRFSDCSGLHLFIAADNLRLDIPSDLKSEWEDSDEIAPALMGLKIGERVYHTGRSESGTVISLADEAVHVEFDNLTSRGNKSVGVFDKGWFKTHDGWLRPVPATSR